MTPKSKSKDNKVKGSSKTQETKKNSKETKNPSRETKKSGKKEIKRNPEDKTSDPIKGLTRPAIQRILRRAGVKRVGGEVYVYIRKMVSIFLEDILYDAIIFTEHEKRKTIQIKDLEAALSSKGIELGAGINENAKKTLSLQSCNSRGKSGTKSSHTTPNPNPNHISGGGVKKPHRFKPGTVATRQIKFQQKNSDCLAFPLLNFNRIVRAITSEINNDIRFSKGVSPLLQLVTEDHFIKFCEKSYKCALHAKRETLMEIDLMLVDQLEN